jgi:hypothetical protein
MDESFYVVWNPRGGNPRVRHDYEGQAEQEAERLARENPGQQFYVLRATKFYERNDIRCVQLNERMPF